MDDLIESIYQAAYMPELWSSVMQDLARELNAAASTILHGDRTWMDGPLLTELQFGFSGAQVKSYQEYYWSVDFRFNEVEKLPAGGVLADDHNFDFERFCKSEIYQDFWKPARLGRGLAGVLFNDERRTSAVTVRRPAGHRSFSRADVRKFRQLLPHMRRSFQFQKQLLAASAKGNALAAALDQFPVAVFLLDGNASVLDHNRCARELLADPHTPLQIHDRRLTAFRPADNRQLQETVSLSARSLHQLEAVPRFLQFLMRDQLRLLALMPVPVARSFLGTAADLVLLFCRQTTASFIDPARLQARYGFTPAEAKLAAAIAEGVTLEEFAAQRGISVGTARAQLKSVMAKADVHTQAQLAGAILRSLAALVRGS